MNAKVKEDRSLEASIFFNQPTGMLAFNAELEIIACNRSFANHTNRIPKNLIGLNLFDFVKFDKETKLAVNNTLIGQTGTGLIWVDEKRIGVSLSPLFNNEKVVGGTVTLGEEIIGSPKLNHLSKSGFKSVIENAPVTIMIFRQNGSVFYTNQSYQELWGLSDRELYLIHEYYNVFEDIQLSTQAVSPYVKKAFKGNRVELPVIKYKLNYSGLGRKDYPEKVNWLMGYFFPLADPDNGENLVALIFTDITRQIEAEQAFRISQERLEMAFEGGELGTWDWNLENNSIVYNKQWAKMLGYELDEVNVLTWEEVVHPDDIEWVKEELDNHIIGKSEAYKAEYRIKTKEGGWKWILDRGKVVEFGSNGKAKRVSGTHFDITSQKEGEDVLKASEERYKNLVDNLPTGVLIEQDKKIVYANRKLLKMMKTESDEALIGVTSSQIFSDEAHSHKVKTIIANNKPDEPTYETQLIDSRGVTKAVEITSVPVLYNGQPAIQSILSDIQERKEIEQQTIKAEKLLSHLFENAPMGIVMLGFDDEILQVNSGFEEMFGFERKEVVGRYINDVIVPKELMNEGKELSKDSGLGKMVYSETERLNSKNELVPVMIYTLPVVHEGKRLGVYGIYIDIRKRLKVEEELNVRNLELDNFVYKVSHDLRAPLASILGLINLVKLEGGLDQSLEYLNLMENQVHKLDHFIHDVLSHSKNLKMSLITSTINFQNVIDKCVLDLGYLDGFDRLTRNVTIDCAGFKSDKWRINEIFRNLIANAIKYQDYNKAKRYLDISIKGSTKGCMITISDNGIGISEDNMPHIFEMFYRATDSSTGSGIGLYIVKNAVEKLSGKIDIESKLGERTTFNIWLPSLKN